MQALLIVNRAGLYINHEMSMAECDECHCHGRMLCNRAARVNGRDGFRAAAPLPPDAGTAEGSRRSPLLRL